MENRGGAVHPCLPRVFKLLYRRLPTRPRMESFQGRCISLYGCGLESRDKADSIVCATTCMSFLLTQHCLEHQDRELFRSVGAEHEDAFDIAGPARTGD